MSILDKPQLAGMAIGKGARSIRRALYSLATSLTGFAAQVPEYISKAPPDLRAADPLLAEEFYNGRFVFGGKLVETSGRSPFLIGSQGSAWDRELHSFEWLRHLSASKDKLTPNYARVLISDWIELHKKVGNSTQWEVDVTARRLISWLSNSVMLLSNSDHEFHLKFMRALGAHVRFLRREVSNAPSGVPKLLSIIALAYASICHEGQGISLENARTRLAAELDSQILPDGGHISRDPSVVVDILLLLLPLKEGCIASGVEPPAEMLQAIDRMLPAINYFRMGDGNLARFNGTGHIDRDHLATLKRHEMADSEPISDATFSAYQRMQIGQAILLMDTGDPPKGELSKKAHAGCLSFEYSYGSECLIVNCGRPKFPNEDEQAVWRSSAAHSTVVLNETSFCKFEGAGALGRYVSGQIYSANLKAESAREDGSDFSAISAAHHGYVRDFGIRHQRNLILDADGMRLSGNDWFSTAEKGDLRPSTKDRAAFHFHLAPEVKASLTSDGQSCMLETRSGSKWIFSAPGFPLDLEPSIFFAGVAGPVPNWQIVIRTRVATSPEIKWVLQKLQTE